MVPAAAVILIGANNLGRLHWPADDDVAGIEAVVAEAHRELRWTKILLLGVLPSDRGAWVLRQHGGINGALAARYRDGRVPEVTFFDLPRFSCSGRRGERRAVPRSAA